MLRRTRNQRILKQIIQNKINTIRTNKTIIKHNNKYNTKNNNETTHKTQRTKNTVKQKHKTKHKK